MCAFKNRNVPSRRERDTRETESIQKRQTDIDRINYRTICQHIFWNTFASAISNIVDASNGGLVRVVWLPGHLILIDHMHLSNENKLWSCKFRKIVAENNVSPYWLSLFSLPHIEQDEVDPLYCY